MLDLCSTFTCHDDVSHKTSLFLEKFEDGEWTLSVTSVPSSWRLSLWLYFSSSEDRKCYVVFWILHKTLYHNNAIWWPLDYHNFGFLNNLKKTNIDDLFFLAYNSIYNHRAGLGLEGQCEKGQATDVLAGSYSSHTEISLLKYICHIFLELEAEKLI